MSENIGSIPNGGVDDYKGQEQVKTPVLTPEQKQMIQSDPRLRELNSSPDTVHKTQGIISDNPQVFTATDNPAVKNQLLGDMGIASNGMKFADMEKMSPEEINKLSPQIQEEFAVWGEENNQQLNQAAIVRKNEESKIDQEKVREKSELEQNKEQIDTLTKSALNSLSDSGKSLIDSELEKARNDQNNPVNRELAKTLSPEQIKDPKYDDMRRASIMVGIVNNPKEFEKFKAQGFIKDEKGFIDATTEIKKLGVVPSHVSLDNYSAHIDSRFPKGESTERAKSEIARSVTSGNVSSIYYDGKGEKYTLIDKDGKTSKEVYMNPPKIRVAQAGFEAEEAIVPSDDTRKRVDKQNELGIIQGKTKEKIGKIILSERGVFDENIPLNGDRSEYKKLLGTSVFNENFTTLQNTNSPTEKKIESTEKLIQAYREARDTPTINKDLYDRKIQELDEVKRSLQEEIKLQGVIAGIPTTSSEDFENNVKENFTTLSTDPRLYNRFPRPQELLTGILGEINRTRDTKNQIKIGERVLGQSEKRSIDEAYEKVLKYIGTDSSILKSAEIGNIQPRITELLQGKNRELRRILANTEGQKSEVK